MKISEKAMKMLEGKTEVLLASVGEEGYPRVCVLSKTKSEGINKVWVSTGLNSTKVSHFNKNPKSSVCFYEPGNSVTLTGKVTIRTDPEIKKEMWLDWFINHYTGGVEDPNYCILEFETEEATLFIDQEFVTLKKEEF